MSIGEVLISLKQNKPKPIYLILGKESYLVNRVKENMIDSFLNNEVNEFNFAKYDMEEHPLGSALEEAESFPFFGEKKVVFIENPFFLTGEKNKAKIEHDFTRLENYLKNPSEFSVLVFIAPYSKLDQRKKITKLLKKVAILIDTQPMKEYETKSFIKEEIRSSGYSIQPEAFEKLLALTDLHLTHIMNELEKLKIYHMDTKHITLTSVENLVSKSLEQNIFELNDYILKKNTGEALELYQELLLQKEEPIKIIALMLSQFRLLLQVKILRTKGYQQADIAKLIKVHPYRVKLALQQEKKFEQTTLSQAYNGLIEADYRIKTGQGNVQMQFELFILSFCAVSKQDSSYQVKKLYS
ncbi:DNA polymerase III subunit delta [Lacticigenium naphthae]|uniref:DNA polymerase III subunit delta n=1 Tax=Lacticigenium naphthae TaxID=515351 RepID=UPI000426F4AE|nr:DNA polymerase III subunit delta [Lacticigenium naphthae]